MGKDNKAQINFYAKERLADRLEEMSRVRGKYDHWANKRPNRIDNRSDLITDYCLTGLAADDSYLEYMEEKEREADKAAMEMQAEDTLKQLADLKERTLEQLAGLKERIAEEADPEIVQVLMLEAENIRLACQLASAEEKSKEST